MKKNVNITRTESTYINDGTVAVMTTWEIFHDRQFVAIHTKTEYYVRKNCVIDSDWFDFSVWDCTAHNHIVRGQRDL